MGIVDFFQAVEIEKQDGERPVAAIGAFGLAFEDIQQAAVIGEAGEGIADSEMTNLLEQSRIFQQSSTECDGVTHYAEAL